MRNPEEVTILITGATDGLGQRVATDLARKGVTLLLHGRDPDKGERVRTRIREATGNDRLHYFNADLASLAEVDRLAAAVADSQPRLDVLINNAGVGAGSDPARRETSVDGFELRFAVITLLRSCSPAGSCRCCAGPRSRRAQPASSMWRRPHNRPSTLTTSCRREATTACAPTARASLRW